MGHVHGGAIRAGRRGHPDAHRRGDGAGVWLRVRRSGGAAPCGGLSGKPGIYRVAGIAAGGRAHLCRPAADGAGHPAGSGGGGAAGKPQQHAGGGISPRHSAAGKPTGCPDGAAYRRTAWRGGVRRLRLGVLSAAAVGGGGAGAGGGVYASGGGGDPPAGAGSGTYHRRDTVPAGHIVPAAHHDRRGLAAL